MSSGISGRRAATLFSARMVTPAVTFLIYAWVSRRGAPGTLGLYYYAYNFVTIFQILANFGYDSFLMREVAKTPERARSLLTNSLCFLLPYGALLAVTMPSAAHALGYPSEVVSPLYPGALALPAMAIAYALEAVLIGQERFGTMLAGSLCDGVVRTALSGLALARGRGAADLLLALAIGRAAAVVFYLFCVARDPGLRPFSIHPAVLGELLRGAGPFFLMYVAYAMATRLDGALLARFAAPSDGDAYSIPSRLVLAVWLLSSSVVGTIYPAMARAAGTPALPTMVCRTIRFFLLPALPAAAMISCFPLPIMQLLAGSRNAPASAPILVWLAWVIVPLSCNEPALRGLLAAGGQRSSVLNAGVVLIASGALMGYGVMRAGALGAARAFPLVVLTDCLLNLWALHRLAGIPTLPGLLAPCVLAGAVTTPLLYLLAPHIGMASAIPYLASYVALLLLFGAVTPRELADPRRLLRFS